MQIAKISIKNILGIKSLEFNAGQFVEITGDNGTGKTSIQEAIKAALKGGHDGTLLHKGAESGEVVLVFDNGVSVTKSVTADKSKIDVEGTTKPAEYLNRIRELTSVNPVSLLLADKKDRLQIFLKAIPFKFDYTELEKIIGLKVTVTANPLEVIDYWREKHFNDRTGVNRSLKDKEAYIRNFEKTIPAEPETSYADTIEAMEGERSAAEADRDGIKYEAEQTKAAATKRLTDELNATIAKANAEYNAAMAKVTASYSKTVEDADTAYTEKVAPIISKIAQAHEAEKQVAVIQDQQATLTRMREDAYHTKQEAEDFTRILEQIDALKDRVLTNIPIPGLDIRNGEIFIDGVEWDRVNEARRTLAAIQVAKLAAGELKIICLDGMEHLSDATYAEFKKHAEESDCQFFVSRVADHPLSIN
jgi:AAA15 family ATPase/GTPase